jgi:hypothetical protein
LEFHLLDPRSVHRGTGGSGRLLAFLRLRTNQSFALGMLTVATIQIANAFTATADQGFVQLSWSRITQSRVSVYNAHHGDTAHVACISPRSGENILTKRWPKDGLTP